MKQLITIKTNGEELRSFCHDSFLNSLSLDMRMRTLRSLQTQKKKVISSIQKDCKTYSQLAETQGYVLTGDAMMDRQKVHNALAELDYNVFCIKCSKPFSIVFPQTLDESPHVNAIITCSVCEKKYRT